MPPFSVVLKPSSGMCNMSCDYCFYCDESRNRSQQFYGFMSEQTLKNVIRKTILRADGEISYVFQGGEPTLCGVEFFKKAISFQKQYNRRGIRVNNMFQTNGYLLDEKWCQFLKENHFLVGISVDGIKQTHDKYRHSKDGGATYDRVIRATELLEQYGVDYNILTVVNREVAENIEKIYESYKRRGWKFQQYIACLDPLGEIRGDTEYALTPKLYGDFLIKLFHLWYMDQETGDAPYIRQFDNYVGILAGYQPESCEQRGTCGVHIVVEGDGSVYPCDFYVLDEYCLGNFNTHQLDKIDEVRRKIRFVERSKLLWEKCRNCEYFTLCRGGCQRNRLLDRQSGTYENYFCESYRMLFREHLGRMKKAAVRIALYW